MKKRYIYHILFLLFFPLIGFAQDNNQAIQNTKLKVEILEKTITNDSVIFIGLGRINFMSGQATSFTTSKTLKSPKNGFVFVKAKIKLTNNQKKTIKLQPVQNLVVQNQDGIKSDIYINYNTYEPLSYQNMIYDNEGSRHFFYKLKKNEWIVVNIIVELPKNSDKLFVEYIE